eukprot:m.150145 g.150145  ORF g.150145 m.150145 type:complete len:129 (-) comp17825_c0_seq35:3531-3917(-)
MKKNTIEPGCATLAMPGSSASTTRWYMTERNRATPTARIDGIILVWSQVGSLLCTRYTTCTTVPRYKAFVAVDRVLHLDGIVERMPAAWEPIVLACVASKKHGQHKRFCCLAGFAIANEKRSRRRSHQ